MKIKTARRGAALMIALLVTVLLAVLGTGLLYFLERDGQFTLGLQRSQRAQVLAMAGLNYARLQEMAYQRDPTNPPPPFPAGGPPQRFDVDAARSERFYLWKEAIGGQPIHSRSEIADSNNRVLASRELAACTLNSSGGESATFMLTWYWDVDL